jgi:hypothetical protein
MPTDGNDYCRSVHQIALKTVFALISLLLVAGCSSTSTTVVRQDEPLFDAFLGQSVEVHLRRDALGLASDGPVPAGWQGAYANDLVMVGRLTGVTADWVILDGEPRLVAVPTSAVLSMELGP